MINLTSYVKELNLWKKVGDKNSELLLCMMNIDDIFRSLNNIGAEEVKVNKEEMNLIVGFYLANARDSSEAMKEGKIDKFFGIKLIYDGN